MAGFVRWLTDPDIGALLLRDDDVEDEVIADLVRKHWVCYTIPALVALAGLLCWVVLVPFAPVSIGWLPILRRPRADAVGRVPRAADQHRPVRDHQPEGLPRARPAQPPAGRHAARAGSWTPPSTSRCWAGSSTSATSPSSPRPRTRGCATSATSPTSTRATSPSSGSPVTRDSGAARVRSLSVTARRPRAGRPGSRRAGRPRRSARRPPRRRRAPPAPPPRGST